MPLFGMKGVSKEFLCSQVSALSGQLLLPAKQLQHLQVLMGEERGHFDHTIIYFEMVRKGIMSFWFRTGLRKTAHTHTPKITKGQLSRGQSFFIFQDRPHL